jgi:hypothetical protein
MCTTVHSLGNWTQLLRPSRFGVRVILYFASLKRKANWFSSLDFLSDIYRAVVSSILADNSGFSRFPLAPGSSCMFEVTAL